MKAAFKILFSTWLLAVSLSSLMAQESSWPRTLPLEQGTVTIYRPQIDEKQGDMLRFRAALAYRESASAEPVFGAGWFESVVRIDQKNRLVRPQNLRVTETRFPSGTADVETELAAVFAAQSPRWNLDFSLDELEASLEATEQQKLAAANLNTLPPKIYYRDKPALLITIDGEPVLREIEDSRYQAVINTPYPLIVDGRDYYLNTAKGVWYKAASATGPFRFISGPPAAIAALVTETESTVEDTLPAEIITSANAPEIIVTTEPAELLVTEGPADFVPLVDDLLVLQNSEDDVFMHVGTQQYFIVLAGRWYRSGSLNGPWTFSESDQLPAVFANIPVDSEQADSRVYVAGTDEAREAVLDAQVPQTAAVQRGPVDIDVEYDGDPAFRPVEGTNLNYADNTASTVLQSHRRYYLVEDGVWYVSDSPDGPWQVSDYRPGDVEAISPRSPVYNVKYVYIYDSTPEVVYVGYTPGYYGSYVYYDTLVYGTGWRYRPWVSPRYYYPRYSTWGFHVGYNPWGGWSFGLSWGWGPFSATYYSGGYWHQNYYWGHHHHGWWGPRGYRPRPVHYGYNDYRRYRYGHHDRYAGGHGNYGRRGGRGYGRHDRGNWDRGGWDRSDRSYGDQRRGRGNDNYAGNGRDRGGRGFNDYAGNDRNRDRNGRGKYERDNNLYRDSRQRAKIAYTQDRTALSAEQTRQTTRLARQSTGDKRTNRGSDRPSGRLTKSNLSKTGVVKRTDLRSKASFQDESREVRRTSMVADKSARINRKSLNRSDQSKRSVDKDMMRSKARSLPDRKETIGNRKVLAGNPPGKTSSARFGNNELATQRNRSGPRGVRKPSELSRQQSTQRARTPVAKTQKTKTQKTSALKANDPGTSSRGRSARQESVSQKPRNTARNSVSSKSRQQAIPQLKSRQSASPAFRAKPQARSGVRTVTRPQVKTPTKTRSVQQAKNRSVPDRSAYKAKPQARQQSRAQPTVRSRPQTSVQSRPQQARPQAKPQSRPQVRPQARPQSRPLVKPSARPQVRPQARPQARAQSRPASKASSRSFGGGRDRAKANRGGDRRSGKDRS